VVKADQPTKGWEIFKHTCAPESGAQDALKSAPVECRSSEKHKAGKSKIFQKKKLDVI
jgi:hypothetical protein